MKYARRLDKKNWNSVVKKKLWPNQQQALMVMDQYLDGDKVRQAMIRMPTGSGKSIIISMLAQLLDEYPRVLVVAPWKNLAEQLKREISKGTWNKLKEMDTVALRPVNVFTPATIAELLDEVSESGVLICTKQSLQLLRKNEIIYDKLRSWTTLTLVDEGHREPAVTWAEAVRELRSPTVLFTATPYRNDRQLFDIGHDYVYSYTFDEALSDRIVREVEFIDGNWTRDDDYSLKSFIECLTETCHRIEQGHDTQSNRVRVIVRCNTAKEIKTVVQTLRSQGQTAIGIHERFNKTDGDYLFNKVPFPDQESAQYWVHQNKLIEGFDDPDFRLVAIYGAFRNARSLVQQVGRVTRNPSRSSYPYEQVHLAT